MGGNRDYILGLDIGTNSLGWAVLADSTDLAPDRLIRTGVRVFAAGVEGSIESGRDVSRAVKRREARLHRRMLERHSRRMTKLANLLQKSGLLPPGVLEPPQNRHQFFLGLDQSLFPVTLRRQYPHTLPYLLRSRALDGKLTAYELGRAIYHLAQRRGFLSNRKSLASEEAEEGVVKEDIAKLAKEMEEARARTLGEHFSHLDPTLERIRQRWTSRQMYLNEFEAIWNAQVPHHPGTLTPELKKNIHAAIFFQRPLKWDRNLIGSCELEKGRRRAPLAVLESQRFRLLQKVNDLRFGGFDPDTGEIWPEVYLTGDRRDMVVKCLEEGGDLTFAKFRKILRLPKWVTINFEEGGEKKLLGNRTSQKLRDVFGDRWTVMSDRDRTLVIEDLLSIHSPKTLVGRATRVWGLGAEEAARFSTIALEPDYCRLSRQALKKVLPRLEKGTPFATARKELYGELKPPAPCALLPALHRAPITPVRNPSVERSLTEVRRVVNAAIARWGKPRLIRVELARDLKRGRDERRKIHASNSRNRKARESAAERLLKDHGIQNPSRSDIEKWLLAEECEWVCPYTGKSISGEGLFGPHPQFDVEHIVPFSRSLEDTYFNKTLCDVDENRHAKRNRTPWEAYGADSDRWEAILQRVRRFRGDAASAKLDRFQLKDQEEFKEFTDRQLSDTRFASRLAIEYLGLLYGTGAQGVDADHTRRIQVGRGMVTKYLRDEWGLNRILGDGGEKTRADHRHHAVDAIAIALTEGGTIKALSDAASRANSVGRRRFAPISPPWPTFSEDVKRTVEGIAVSHRPFRKVSGPLHEETLYSPPKGMGEPRFHIRKPLESLSSADVDEIVDGAVRETVKAALGNGDPKKVFSDRSAHPRLPSGMQIHRVRVRKRERAFPIGKGKGERWILTGANHHLEVFEYTDKKGQTRWDGVVVSMMEAARRLREGRSVVNRDHGENRRFLFSLCGGDLIQLTQADGTQSIKVVRIVTKSKRGGNEYPSMSYVAQTDARLKTDIVASGDWGRSQLEPLRKLGLRKVTVSALGDIQFAND